MGLEIVDAPDRSGGVGCAQLIGDSAERAGGRGRGRFDTGRAPSGDHFGRRPHDDVAAWAYVVSMSKLAEWVGPDDRPMRGVRVLLPRTAGTDARYRTASCRSVPASRHVAPGREVEIGTDPVLGDGRERWCEVGIPRDESG